MSQTVSIVTLGCKTNQFESAAMEEDLKSAGYRTVPFENGAELVIVNTCTVTAATDSQSRNLIRRARRLNPECRIVVTGCYAQIEPEELKALPGVSLVIGNNEKAKLRRLLTKQSKGAQIYVSNIRRNSDPFVPGISSFPEHSRAFLQIQNGCDAFCSYCIIPYARGRSRSVLPEQVLQQVDMLATGGYPEVVLTGIHIGGYGKDLQPPSSLVQLVKRIEKETGVRRLRLGSVEPTEIPDDLIDAVARSEVLCPHFHIPLQAGDDAVLRRMNRHYTTEFFRDLTMRIRERIPHAAIGLDVIAGFPGETEEEFQNAFKLIEDLPVTHLHVFPFSRRPGTPAARMPNQVSGKVAKERAASLRALGESKNRDFARRFVGKELEVVVEKGNANAEFKGLTKNYLTVFLKGGEELKGQIARVRVIECSRQGLRGELI